MALTDFVEDLLVGVGMFLADNEVVAWRSDGSAYAPGELPFFIRAAMPDTPDNAVSVALYDTAEEVSRDGEDADAVMFLQFRTRGAPVASSAYPGSDTHAEAIYKAFGLPAFRTLVLDTGVIVLLIDRTSTGLLGQDVKGRPERTDNYAFHVTRPA